MNNARPQLSTYYRGIIQVVILIYDVLKLMSDVIGLLNLYGTSLQLHTLTYFKQALAPLVEQILHLGSAGWSETY